MQSDTSRDNRRQLRQVRHVGVHLLVHQPECNRLVAHERLIVALRVRDALFAVSPVGERVHDVREVPLVVALVLACT